jgi:hypothetical protein
MFFLMPVAIFVALGNVPRDRGWVMLLLSCEFVGVITALPASLRAGYLFGQFMSGAGPYREFDNQSKRLPRPA